MWNNSRKRSEYIKFTSACKNLQKGQGEWTIFVTKSDNLRQLRMLEYTCDEIST